LLFLAILTLLIPTVSALMFIARLRQLRAVTASQAGTYQIGNYRPMLRLLAEEDFRMVADHPVLYRKLRQDRYQLFRRYLRSLAKDYGKLLSGIRTAMVTSGADRPDLANALLKNQLYFTAAICRIELRLALHRAGLANVDVSGLVEAIDILRVQATAFAPSAA
jgi:hypothetical protein